MRRPAQRTVRALAVAAAVPVLLAGCSGGSSGGSGDGGSAKDKGSSSASPTRSAAPSAAPAKYTKLPDACRTVSKKSVQDLVPEAKDTGGKPLTLSDPDNDKSCSWNGLDGYQYRWLNVELKRAQSVPGGAGANSQATAEFTKLKGSAAAPDGLKKGSSPSIRTAGIGDESELVSAEVAKDKDTYRTVTVIARQDNVTIEVTYEGAGFEGDKTPKAADIEQGALTAAKQALAALGT